jgi:RNA polymerase sigma-70 factor (ECF subfamily)
MEEPMETSRSCCGRPHAEECRCYTDAEAIAGAVRAFVARRVRRPHDVEDVTQEALLRLYRGARALNEEGALEAWMYRIAQSAVIDHRRRAAKRPEPIDPETADETIPAEPEEEPRADESLARCLDVLVARVPEGYREALELTDLGGMTQTQAAARLGLSTSGMKSRVQRGRAMLRVEVDRCCRVALDAGGRLSDASTRDDSGAC